VEPETLAYSNKTDGSYLAENAPCFITKTNG